jgi:hypothetical protein
MRIQRHMHVQIQINPDLQAILLLIHSFCALLPSLGGYILGLAFGDQICGTTLVLAASEAAGGIDVFNGVVVGFGTIEVFGAVWKL